MEPDFEALAHEIATSMANMRQVLAPIDEATLGYRKQLEESGWSPSAAEQMALQFFSLQMTGLINSMQAGEA